MALFGFKRRALSDKEDEARARKLANTLLEDAKVPYPTGLRLKVRNKKALTSTGRDALASGDELIIADHS